MTNKSFKEWMNRHNFNIKQTAIALGCNRLTIMRYKGDCLNKKKELYKIPKYIALACQAYSNGLEPMP